MVELIDTAVKKTFRRFGYDIFREGEEDYCFFKGNAKGRVGLKDLKKNET